MTRKESTKKPTQKRQKQGIRCCLMCSNDFVSDGTHNRVCKRCKGTQAWREGGTDMESAA